MPTLTDILAAELRHEAAVTRRLVERVPGDRLEWQPHPKSMTLGRLVGHIAELPGWGTRTLEQPEVDLARLPAGQTGLVAESVGQALERFDGEVAGCEAALEAAADELLHERWTLRNGDRVYFQLPRLTALRGFVFSHLIHHRGQLTVYLRLLEVPLPQTYGPSADEGW